MKYKIFKQLILIQILLCSAVISVAQLQNETISGEQSGTTQTHIARDYILLNNNFHYKATAATSSTTQTLNPAFTGMISALYSQYQNNNTYGTANNPISMEVADYVFSQYSSTVAGQFLSWLNKSNSFNPTIPVYLTSTTTNPATTFKASIDEFMTLNAKYNQPQLPFSTSNEVGSLPGVADVSPTGAATYTIPISLPPGTAGMMPNLSIVYSSQSPGGMLGVGWTVSGFSSINRTPTNLFNDHMLDEVDFDANDKFALDGQRLINFGTSTTEFRTEKESYLKITITAQDANGPISFKVETKNGTVMEYGTTPDSRVKAKDKPNVLTWLLAKVTDPNQNYMTFTYYNVAGEYYPKSIDYTGNTLAGLNTYNSVTFHFDKKTDENTSYVGGGSVSQKVILSKIKTQSEGQLVKEYQFKYNYDQFSYLNEITEYSQGERFNSTRIDWGTKTSQFTKTDSYSTTAKSLYFFGDYDGNGKADFIKVPDKTDYTTADKIEVFLNRNGTAFDYSTFLPMEDQTTNIGDYIDLPDSYTSKTYGLRSMDFDGDGIDDLMLGLRKICIGAECNGGAGGVEYYFNYMTYLAKSNGTVLENPAVGPFRTSYADHRLYNGDFNGDGLIDYLLYYPANGKKGQIRYPVSGEGSLMFTFPSGWGEDAIAMDYNGNGKTDFLCQNGSSSYVYEYDITSNSLIDISKAGAMPLEEWHAAYPGDFNGDGKSDILFFSKSTNKWKIYYSKGSAGFILKDAPLIGTNNPIYGSDNHCFVGDYNGDRFADIIEIDIEYRTLSTLPFEEEGRARFNVYYGNGNGFTKESIVFEDLVVETHFEEEDPYDGRISIQNYRNLSFKANNFHFVDLNGDGSLDCFYKDDLKNAAQAIFFHKAEKSNVVESIYNGLNNKTKFTYLPITDNAVYETGSGNSDENHVIEIRQPLSVVYEMTQPTGVGSATNKTQFKYKGLKYHKTGRGLLGFEKVTATNQYGYDVESEYNYDLSFFNVYLRNKKTKFKGTLISEVDFPEVSTESLDDGKRFRTYAKKTIETDHLSDITTTSTINTIDAYGNIELQTIDHDGEGTSSISTSYLKVNGWCKSEVDISTTTKTRTGSTKSYIRKVDNNYANGRLSETIADQGDPLQITTTYSDYNAIGLPKTTTVVGSGKTNRTLIEYDSKSRAGITKTFKGPNNIDYVSRKSYDFKTGNVLSETDAQGNTTNYTYDAFGQLIRTTLPNGNKITQSAHWASGSVPVNCMYYVETVPDGYSANRIYYDALGRALREENTGFDGRKIFKDAIYDVYGRVIKRYEPYFEGQPDKYSSTIYDTYTSRVDYISTPTGMIDYTYPPNKRETKIVDQAKHVVIKTINAYGELDYVTDEGGNIDYVYGPNGLPSSISASGSGTITLDYDLHGNRKSIDDPNLGQPVTSVYDAFGNLTYHEDAKGNYTMIYDNMSRPTSKTGSNDQPTTYTYVESGNGLGQIETVSYNNIVQSYNYDSYGRSTKLAETMDGADFEYEYTYDQYGRQKDLIYPKGKNGSTNFATTNVYNTYGFLEEIKQTGAGTIWKANAMNALGQYESITKGNGKTTNYTYDPYHRTKTSTTTGILQYEYNFDKTTGNLLSRTDHRRSLTESFTYDDLNRLDSAVRNGICYLDMEYADNGNILQKTDAGTFGYNATGKPHAVLEITNPQNTIPSANQSITYTAFNKVGLIEEWDEGESKKTLTFTYGADQQRRKTIYNDGTADVLTKYFMGAYEEEINAPGQSRKLYYIGGGDGLAAVYIVEGGTGALHYTYTDHLGSILAVTNTSGGIEQEQSFDPWGRRRSVTNWNYSSIQVFDILDRGYTGHQHLYAFNIINMNGRLYDPVLGRMLSPDNFVQMPDFTQSFNRFAYCVNNPLKYTDPDGEFWHLIIGGVVGGVINVATNWNNSQGFWEHLSAFGAGAASGVLTAAWGPGGAAIGGGITGGVNNLIAQTGPNFSGKVDWGQVGLNSLTGAGSGIAGAYAGKWASNKIGDAVIGLAKVTSPLIASTIKGIAGGFGGGYAGGFVTGYILSGGDLDIAMDAGWSNAKSGAVTGGSLAAVSSYANCKKYGIDIWNGKSKWRTEPAGIQEQMALEAAKQGAGVEIMEGQINDKYWKGYQKIEYTVEGGVGKVIIHYWRDPNTGNLELFKFKNPPIYNKFGQ